MTLLELCEPLFQYLCRLNRLARKGGSADAGQVRAELKALFSNMRDRADREGALAIQWEKIELPLMFFADFMIRESRLSFAVQWKDLAHERGEMAGYEKFFELLDQTLADPSEQATQRLAVYYTCIGLGFTGIEMGRPEVLRRKMVEISTRLRGQVETDLNQRICPESYEKVDTRILTEPMGRSLTWLVVFVIGISIVVFVGYAAMYLDASDKLRGSIQKINDVFKNPGRADAGPAGAVAWREGRSR